jgi:hypothetical protein
MPPSPVAQSARDEGVDPGDDAIQHRLDARDQTICGLKGEVANGSGQRGPDRLDRIEGPLEHSRSGVAEPHDRYQCALHGIRHGRRDPVPTGRKAGHHSFDAKANPVPDLAGQIRQQPKRRTKSASALDQFGKLIDQLARSDDQSANPGADERPFHDSQGQGKPADAKCCRAQSHDETSGEEGGKRPGDGGNLANKVSQKADACLENATLTRGSGQRIGDCLQRWGHGDGQLVGQTKPDQIQPVDGIACCADLVCILIGDGHAKIGDVLGCLAESGRVDSAEGQCRLVAEERRGHCGPLGWRHEIRQRILNGDDALVERQRLQIGGGQVKPLQRIDGGAGATRCIRQLQGEFFGRGCDLVHRDPGQIARERQHLNAAGGGAQGLRQIGLRVDGLEAGFDHRDACGSCRRHGNGGRNLHPGGKCRQPRIGNLRFPGHAAKAFDPGITDTFKLCAHLFAADRRKADGYAFLSHLRLRSFH